MVIVTDRLFEVHVAGTAVAVNAGVTTTARAVAQYCMLEAAGKLASEGCIVRSRLVTVTLGYVGVMDTAPPDPEPPDVELFEELLPLPPAGEVEATWRGPSCIFRFRERVIGPILVMETLLLLEG